MSLRWQPRLRLCFYSLQAGRRFQTSLDMINDSERVDSGFDSLQPGRRFQTNFYDDVDNLGFGVSIPFKREGVSKQELRMHIEVTGIHVSIPFKREGVSKRIAS